MRVTPLAALLAVLPATLLAKPLTVCTEANPEGFDVVQYNSLTTTNASADVLMNRLVDYDARAKKVVASLAASWTVSPDGKVYTFRLRPNAAFHKTDYFTPTRPLTSADVVASFERMLKPANPWHKIAAAGGFPHAQAMQFPTLIKSVSAPDAQTVRFELNTPEATFLSALTMGFASIYSAEYMGQLAKTGRFAELNAKPVGTGPFVFKSFQKDAVIRYDANPAYFAGKPRAERLIYAITPDATVRAQKLKAGECQIALSPKPQDVAAARANPTEKVVETPAFMTAFVAPNSQKKPWSDARVRRALNYAFDKKSYLKTVFADSATAAHLPYPPNTWSYAKALPDYGYDPAKARALLAEAGYAKGFDTTIWVRPAGSLLNPNPKAGAEQLQADLAKVGVRAQIKVVEWGELIRRAKAGEHELLFMGWAGDNGDPDNFLTPQFSCAAVQSGTNFARYCDKGLDKLIAHGRQTSDVAARTRDYQAAQKLIHEQALWLPLAHPVVSVLTRANVDGYVANPFGRQDFSRVTVR